MAIKQIFQTKFGVGGEYVNFDPQIANKTKINLRMKFWKDKETREIDGNIPFNNQMSGNSNERIVDFKCNYQFDYDLNSPLNVFQQGYEYLKTLPEFAEAIDDITEKQTNQLDAVKNIQLNVRPVA